MQTEIVFGFDIGSNSTKVSFSPPGKAGTMLTKEFPNVVLFMDGNEKLFGEEALRKIAENPELHSAHFVTNFARLIFLTSRQTPDEKETFFTFCNARAAANHQVLLNPRRDGTPVTPEKCLGYFLAHIRQHILRNFFGKGDGIKVRPVVAVEDKFNLVLTSALARIFDQSGYARPECVPASLAVGILYNKLHNYLSQKNVVVLDVGYSAIRLSLIRTTPTELELIDSAEVDFGLRDFDFEVYINVISELKAKYRIDYQKDKYVRFDFLRKMHQVRKTFGLRTGYVVNLAETFGARYFDQFFRVDLKRYQDINNERLERFAQFVTACHRKWCMDRDIVVQDFQVIGGGVKISRLVGVVENKFEMRSLSDKLSNSFSKCYGAFLAASASEELTFRFPQDLRYKIYELPNETVNSGAGSQSSQVYQQSVLEETKVREEPSPDREAAAAGEELPPKKLGASEVDISGFNGPKRPEELSEFNVIDEHFQVPGKSVKVATEGVIYGVNDLISLKKNEKVVALGALDRSRHFQLVVMAESPDESLPTILLFKQQLPFSDIQTFSFEIDRALSVRPLHFLPENKRIEFALHRPRFTDISRLSVYESVVSRPQERPEPGLNLSLKEKSKCSCPHSADSKESKLKKHSLVNAAFLHIVSDIVQDLVILFVGILLYFKPEWEVLDPIFTIISLAVLMGIVGQFTYRLYVRLMEAVPADLNYQAILSSLLKVPNVVEIHDLHIWELGNSKRAATAHVVTNENKDQVLKDATVVFRQFSIYHSTVQVESVAGKNQEFYVSCKNDIDN